MTDCILWTGRRDRKGYGRIGDDLAHRRSYVQAFGSIPDGYALHHLCGVPLCINPLHLRPVSPAEHAAAHAENVTHCIHGHPFDAANTYIRTSSSGGRRSCRACNLEAVRRYTARRSAA